MAYDVVIIGGGIVGLASAYQLKKRNPSIKLALLEKEHSLASHQTGHNSGVIHSGVYYKPGSLKATNCLRGYAMLVDFLKENDIPFELCGKVIVATDKSELPQLEALYQRGKANGLEGLRRIGPEGIKEHEPHCNGIEAIYVPQTGIVDYKLVAEVLGKRLQEMGADIFLGKKVEKIVPQSTYSDIYCSSGQFSGRLLINCAGLFSDKIATMAMGNINTKIIPFRGEYFELVPERRHLVKGLIYPVPDPSFPFLGVHFTKMINGGVEAGPNAVFAFRREGYSNLDISFKDLTESLSWPGFQKVASKYWKTGLKEVARSFNKNLFVKALQRLIPEIQSDDLLKAPAGVRAQACDKEGGLLDDFKIVQNSFGIHVINAPSPAATSSLSIGLTVAELAEQYQTA